MACSWHERQTSPQEEEDLEQEGYSAASIRERLHRCRDWTSSEEDSEDPPYEEEEEEDQEKRKKLAAIPIDAIKIIINEDKINFVRETPALMGKCGFSNCTIHDPLEESGKIDPMAREMHTIGARMQVGPPRKRRNTAPVQSIPPQVQINNLVVETKAMTNKIREMELALPVKAREALDTGLRIIANQDATLRMYHSCIMDLEVANNLMIDAITGVTAPPSKENTGINKKVTK